MRIVFMGTPQFAVPSLLALHKAGHEIAAVVTQPDRPNKRGNKVEFSPVKQAALDLQVKVLQPEKIKEADFVAVLKDLQPEAIVVVAFGQILSEEILTLPKYGCINLHASLLPKYRGAAPIHWAVLNGETETGNTTMLMDKGLDTGDMLLVNKVAIGAEETTGQVHDKLSTSGADLLVETLEKLVKNEIVPQKQDEAKSTYAEKLTKELELIDWTLSNRDIFNKIRGLNPWPVAYTLFNNSRLKIFTSKLLDTKIPESLQAGQFACLTENGFAVATGDGLLEIIEVQPESRKRMSAQDYIKGYKVTKEIFFGRN